MTVSVILPVYNSSRFIKEAVDSILSQTFEDFELIIINDGSTDDSEKIIKKYSDPRIKYFYQENCGVAVTLNKGIDLAKGDYIWRHDADDVSLPTKLESELVFLKKHKNIALCACQVAFMTENGKIAWQYRQPKNYYFNSEPYRIVKREDFSPYSPITHGTVLIRADIMKALGGYRREFITGEDVDLWLRLIQQHNAVVLNQCLSFHRLNKGSATQKHGWKNEFFRNLALEYYDQRQKMGADDLQRQLTVIVPDTQDIIRKTYPKGKHYREDLLSFIYPLHVNAKDWREVFQIVRISIIDGWRTPNTWKSIIFPLLGMRLVKAGVRAKRLFK